MVISLNVVLAWRNEIYGEDKAFFPIHRFILEHRDQVVTEWIGWVKDLFMGKLRHKKQICNGIP
jgi:hypothetical protein